MRAFGAGRDRLAITLLAGVRPLAARIGGSHAQRDVLRLTLRRAVERVWNGGLRRLSGARGAQVAIAC